MNPFDLSGRDFLVFWLFGAAIAFAITFVMRTASAGLRGFELDDALAPLSPIDVAYLAGGIERAIEAAVAGLHHRGLVEVDAGGIKLAADLGDPVGLTEVERHVLAELRGGIRGSATSIAAIVRSAHGLDLELQAKLEASGLLVARQGARRLWLLAPGIAWIGVGLIKVFVGLSRGRPVTILVLLLLVSGFLFATIARPPRLASRGKSALDALRARSYGLETTASAAPQQLTGSDVSLAYALFGTSVTLGTLAALMPSYQRGVLAAQQSTWSSSCSSSSSCGGGCGSGCGGCS